ncbi:MAG: DUF885 domain-containing protein [Gammaproteobacteria bacterium]|nr:DUF885 domain-containing protein [Gammaproteobacteria bacterium]NIR90028.1 DUF885 domain-containing protein [Gammaproteobacteria bacterium]NIR99157.1 DUF885 domain-containing protein [Gammaproteobacteria bacterium]NIT64797.1 DUF885 domain-containing protein [Gammaproteobacteria bacterium]NIV53647.1 DUF885 family protein [Gammaproteobacteria bacterium]
MSTVTSEFDRLVRDYYRAWFRYHPEAAVDVGADEYAGLLTPHGDDDVGALLALNEMLLSALDELGPGELEAESGLDFRVLYGAAVIERHELIEQDWRRSDPVRFLPVQAIHQLMLRPVEGFGRALLARLSAIPSHLRSARRQLHVSPERIPSEWLAAAVCEAQRGAHYIRELRRHPRVARAFSTPGRIAALVDGAARSLEEYARFLDDELAPYAAGDFACGPRQFDRILRHRHFLEVDRGGLERFGRELLERTAAELRAVTRELRGDEDVPALTAAIRADHPSAEEFLSVYREQMRAACRFVREHDLVTVPEPQHLRVLATPGFLRHQIPFAAYVEPAPDDPEQRGFYYVTPAEGQELLGEHNRLALPHTCVHEAWPGHHLQFVTANRRAASSSLPRLINRSSTLYEGWALYCEQLMYEQGFLGRPEQRFVLLRDRLWRALRVQLDIELHTAGLPLDQAAERMQRVLGFPREQALADLSWYTRAPGAPLGYATGWALIGAARRRLREEEPDFTLKRFHDRLLAAGSIGLPLALQAAFGDELAREVQRSVFGTQ